MNQPLLLIVLAELCIVLLTGLIVLLAVNRRNKKRRQAGLEELLDDIKDRQERRGERLALALTSKHRIDEESAASLSENLIAAEKHFLYGFVEQQMQQQPVGGFYENLCQLLDSYLDNLAKPAKPASKTDTASDPDSPATAAEEADQPKAPDAGDAPPPPDWGDVFD